MEGGYAGACIVHRQKTASAGLYGTGLLLARLRRRPGHPRQRLPTAPAVAGSQPGQQPPIRRHSAQEILERKPDRTIHGNPMDPPPLHRRAAAGTESAVIMRRPAAYGDRDMFELLRSSTLRQLLARQAPALAISLIVAELFYKFGSFTLECIGFLATWFVLDALFAQIGRVLSKPAEDNA